MSLSVTITPLADLTFSLGANVMAILHFAPGGSDDGQLLVSLKGPFVTVMLMVDRAAVPSLLRLMDFNNLEPTLTLPKGIM